MASSQLLAAQEKLHQLRTEAAKQKNDSPPWETAHAPETAVSAVDLPTHLGWESTAVTQALRYAQTRKEKASLTKNKDALRIAYCVKEDDQASRITHHAKKDFVTHHPSLGIAALQQNDAPCYRVWLTCRYFDEQGRGALNVTLLKSHLTETDSEYRMFSWKRLRQILHAGNGRFWHWNQEKGQLWLVGVAKLAAALDVPKLTGNRVQLPIQTISAGISEFKAHLYAAWHSGRHSENPISREVQRQLTHIPERTQRRYGRIARIKTKRNFAIGARFSAEGLKQEAWQRGHAVFEYKDVKGKFGAENGRYLAWQLPNHYEGPHQPAQFGRQRKINKQLRQQQEQQLQDLVEIGAQGNREKNSIDRLYHPNGAKAVRASQHQPSAYWPLQQKGHSQFWAVIGDNH